VCCIPEGPLAWPTKDRTKVKGWCNYYQCFTFPIIGYAHCKTIVLLHAMWILSIWRMVRSTITADNLTIGIQHSRSSWKSFVCKFQFSRELRL
jgi:hypothetical protein